ncbi:ankyrin repeat and SOCS box protein 17 [Latimeria chalumnae]|uniref:Ankyrin repeat and SOCS box protein 17 n=1 Tax=Latimeria chalumnae TaxID=7897 RepID=H3AE23_LATCH|nr:PREDICTED: ankyrin repeat and SOCS box protein 17 [Latimeria chalumnae]|eukprot:XP_006004874.1 PREDICTED: ankyrin repeat and SOCS box protein 17 [Latimeria chalumnae]
MSDISRSCCKIACVRNNVFSDLIERVVKRTSNNVPGQWDYQSYEPRIYRTLAKILKNSDLDGFESLITEFLIFVARPDHRLELNLLLEFTEVCVNTILYWVFARRGNPCFVELMLKKTTEYALNKSKNLAIIWRTFTPVYSPSPLNGVTPLFYVAQTRQYNILKLLLQYGILERECRPMQTVLTILFYPAKVRILDDNKITDLTEDTKLCIALCAKVLLRITIAEIEAQIGFGRSPIISNWVDYIPITRYKEPCELLHICRVTIRNCLLASNQLPTGIFTLPIPTSLQYYLNLEA